MVCKYCGESITLFDYVVYTKYISKPSHTWVEGDYCSYDEQAIDGGIFCNDICLIEYLKKESSE